MTIILIVGPSGAGKDTLIGGARCYFSDRTHLRFARRYITRPPDSSEQNYYLSREGFRVLRQADFFISDWQAHGFQYGIARHDCPESQATAVVASVSRSSIGDFENKRDRVVTVLVHTPPNILALRLKARGRETPEKIADRIARTERPVQARHLIRFDNSRDRQIVLPEFIKLLDLIVVGDMALASR